MITYNNKLLRKNHLFYIIKYMQSGTKISGLVVEIAMNKVSVNMAIFTPKCKYLFVSFIY